MLKSSTTLPSWIFKISKKFMTFGQICEGWSNFCIGTILVKCQLWVKGFLNYISQVVYFLLVKFHQITIAQKGLQNSLKVFENENS
jgi:hypothetical protein